jgi:uncharacterized protein with ParB-like and HNH nuclease domain/predicted transport protein
MNAQDLPLMQQLDGAKQFIVPIFQRDYSWGTKHCQQLWNDIVRVGADPQTRAHFLGSVVYIAAEDNQAAIPRWLLIDGQQRLTTVSLLFAALRDRLAAHPSVDDDALPTAAEIEDRFLCNRHGKADRRGKLRLRRADDEALNAIILRKPPTPDTAIAIRENYEFFAELLIDADIGVVYAGISKLVIVDVSLQRGVDDPQMIFESLNSTGLDLTQADLIRNYVLMRLDDDKQTSLYDSYWRPIEQLFGNHYSSDFDTFCRDYLVLKLKPSKQYRADAIYTHFRSYFTAEQKTRSIDDILEELKRYATHYARFSLSKEHDTLLREPAKRLRALVEVASPLMLRLYECHAQNKTFTNTQFQEAIVLLESYVFRRSVCDMQTRSLYQIFANIAYKIRTDEPLLSLKIALARLEKSNRFPTDAEFKSALETHNIYTMRTCFYLLDRLENHNNEMHSTSKLTIEHVMPQNEKLSVEWQEMLGADWKTTQDTWLHRLGNLTLTGYNPEYSDRPFEVKKSMKNGFDDSSVRLNSFIRKQSTWTRDQMAERGSLLAIQATSVWPSLQVDKTLVRQEELTELQERAQQYSVDSIGFDSAARALFNAIQPEILAIAPDVIELCGARTVVFRVYDYILEIIPRKGHLALLINIDFKDVDDPTNLSRDTRAYTYITYATKWSGGEVLFFLKDTAQISAALHVIRQAYERNKE